MRYIDAPIEKFKTALKDNFDAGLQLNSHQKNGHHLGWITLLILLTTAVVSATTIQIPADHATIEAGINNSVDGDTILVHPGTYSELIRYNGKNIVIASLFLTTQDTSYISQTVIYGSLTQNTVVISDQDSHQSELIGFTITHGFRGVYCWYSNIVLSHLKVINNEDEGVDVSGSNLTLMESVIQNNGKSGVDISGSNTTLFNLMVSNNGNRGLELSGGSTTLENITIDGNAWAGLQLNSVEAQLSNVTVSNNQWGGVDITGGTNLTAANLIVDQNHSRGINAENGTIDELNVFIDGLSVTNNGGGIKFNRVNGYISDARIEGNLLGSFTQGGGLYLENSDIIISDTDIIGNQAGLGSGIHIEQSSPSFHNVTIAHNLGTGIQCYDDSNPRFYTVEITDNAGSGLYCTTNSNPILSHVTIAGNMSSGISCSTNSSPIVVNSIIDDPISFSATSDSNSIVIAHSNIPGGQNSIDTNENGSVIWEAGNLESDPLFTDPSSSNYQLQPNSPCIDAGSSFFTWQGDTLVDANTSGYNGTGPDLGAIESPDVLSNETPDQLPQEFILKQNYPNPFNSSTSVPYELSSPSQIKIEIFDLVGRKIWESSLQTKPAGYHKLLWNGTNADGVSVATGIYLISLSTPDHKQIQKAVLIK